MRPLRRASQLEAAAIRIFLTGSVCPGEATRSRFVRWEIGEEEEEDNEPLIDVDMATILAQNDAYFRLPAHQRM